MFRPIIEISKHFTLWEEEKLPDIFLPFYYFFYSYPGAVLKKKNSTCSQLVMLDFSSSLYEY